MKKRKIKYTDEPIGKIRIVDNFLPEPKDLVFKEETTKVTLTLTKSSIDFFKAEGAKHHTPYQAMIRELINQYAAHHIR